MLVSLFMPLCSPLPLSTGWTWRFLLLNWIRQRQWDAPSETGLRKPVTSALMSSLLPFQLACCGEARSRSGRSPWQKKKKNLRVASGRQPARNWGALSTINWHLPTATVSLEADPFLAEASEGTTASLTPYYSKETPQYRTWISGVQSPGPHRNYQIINVCQDLCSTFLVARGIFSSGLWTLSCGM